MPRSRPSVAVMIAVLLAVAAAVWAVSVRTRPTFAVYDSVPAPAPSPARPESAAAAVPAALDTLSPAPGAPVPSRRPGTSRSVRPPAATARGDTAADTAAAPDTARHHRSENYGGYSGYGSKERRGTPNAR